jgi:hypothetical protein
MSDHVKFCFSQLIMALCLFIIGASAHADAGQPVASVEIYTYDFGKVLDGTDILHDFTVKNTGDADLEIKDVQAG